jgi:hypothetical protein
MPADLEALDFAVREVDMIGYSFVQAASAISGTSSGTISDASVASRIPPPRRPERAPTTGLLPLTRASAQSWIGQDLLVYIGQTGGPLRLRLRTGAPRAVITPARDLPLRPIS